MALVRSAWADYRITLGGALRSVEWDGAGRMPIPAGYLMVKNDATYLYTALDMVADRGRDPGTGDNFWFTVDVNSNRQITPMIDINYGLYPGHPNRLGRQYYLGPGRWTGLLNEPSDSRCYVGFGGSPNSGTDHRFWEIRLALEELGVDLSASNAPPVIKFGVRVSSTNPRFTYNYPGGFYRDFSNLHEIVLARQPEVNYPPGTAGAVIGGVGLIPASEITPDGYATTDPSYFIHVDEAAFGRRMHLVGNRVTMQKLWDRGTRKHKILHGFGGSGSFSPIRQTWSNYVWDGTRYVLEHFGPDDEDKYPLPNPAKDYSIDDLLLQWQSVGYPAGIHQFQAEFFDDDGNEVPAPAQILTLMVDNNWPEVDIVDVLHNNASVPACSLEYMVDNADGLKFKITANDPAGHLSHYVLDARHGDGRNVPLVSDDYSNHRDPSHRWQGVTDELVPPSEWVPPRTCAYEFRLRAYPRVTNGYNGKQHYCGYVEDTRHVTLIKPEVPRAITPRISADLPLGLLSTDRLDVEGEEPDKLGEETLELLEGN